MARSSATWKPGIPSPNPGGKTLAERVAARTIGEALRELADPADIGRSLLAIYAGVDPFAKKDPADPGGPSFQPVPVDMTHRMAALKMYLEYAYGKPLQGVVVDAQVRQQTTVIEARTSVAELRELAAKDPEARQALRTIARAMLGAPSVDRAVQVAGTQVALGAARPERVEVRAGLELDESSAGVVDLGERVDVLGEGPEDSSGALAVDDGDVVETGAGVDLDVEDLHDTIVEELDAVVDGKEKKPTRGPGIVL